MKTCGTCANWQPPRTAYTKRGTCPLMPKGGDRYPEEKCFSWAWQQASKEQLESRERAGLIEGR